MLTEPPDKVVRLIRSISPREPPQSRTVATFSYKPFVERGAKKRKDLTKLP
jgi:hypothetical protein